MEQKSTPLRPRSLLRSSYSRYNSSCHACLDDVHSSDNISIQLALHGLGSPLTPETVRITAEDMKQLEKKSHSFTDKSEQEKEEEISNNGKLKLKPQYSKLKRENESRKKVKE